MFDFVHNRRQGFNSSSRLLVLVAVASGLWIATASPASATSFGATAWGSGTGGQLGDGTGASKDVPAAVSALTGVIAISTGSGPVGCGFACGGHSLALLSNGTVMAWGNNSGDS